MSDTDRSLTFQGNPGDAYRALQEAARRAGLQHLSADAESGVVVFTSGRFVLASGEKVTARIRATGPDAVEITLSSNVQFGLTGANRAGSGVDRVAGVLTQLLPPAS